MSENSSLVAGACPSPRARPCTSLRRRRTISCRSWWSHLCWRGSWPARRRRTSRWEGSPVARARGRPARQEQLGSEHSIRPAPRPTSVAKGARPRHGRVRQFREVASDHLQGHCQRNVCPAGAAGRAAEPVAVTRASELSQQCPGCARGRARRRPHRIGAMYQYSHMSVCASWTFSS